MQKIRKIINEFESHNLSLFFPVKRERERALTKRDLSAEKKV